MPLQLPYSIDAPDVRGNFDAISLAWPNRNVGVFSVYRNAALAIASNTGIVFDTEEYDVSGWHDTATGRYTPKVPGYYRLSAHAAAAPAAANTIFVILFKNGALLKRGQQSNGNGFSNAHCSVTANVQANGTTDYFQVVFFHDVGGALALVTGADNTYFQGEMIAP